MSTAATKDGAHTSTLGELARILSGIESSALDAATLDAARARMFDTLGALVVGLQTHEGRLLRDYAKRASGGGASLDFAERCRMYVGATRTTELDDIDVASCTTVGSVVAPVALAGKPPAPPAIVYPNIIEAIPDHLQMQNTQQREWLRFSTTHINIGEGNLLREDRVYQLDLPGRS